MGIFAVIFLRVPRRAGFEILGHHVFTSSLDQDPTPCPGILILFLSNPDAPNITLRLGINVRPIDIQPENKNKHKYSL